MRIMIFIAVWKRPEVTRICFDGVKRLQSEVDHDIDCFCVVSEDWAEELCKEYGFKFKRIKNEPLGHKMNRGLWGVMKYKFDYLMTLGSDDLINPDLFKLYEPYMEDHIGLIGIDKVYFADLEKKKCKLVDYDLQIVGAGRMISRKAIKDTANRYSVTVLRSCSTINGSYTSLQNTYMTKPEIQRLGALVSETGKSKFGLWDDERMICLDGNSNDKLLCNRISNKCISVGEIPYIVDIKTNDNLWKYDALEGREKDWRVLNDFREIRQTDLISE